MMTIQQTIDIPADRRLYLELPETVPSGKCDLRLIFTPTRSIQKLDPSTEKMLNDAEKTWAYTRAHPEEVRNELRALRGCTKGSPAWGGLDGVTYKRKIRDEWDM
jgi:hypothetical protein